MSNDHSLFAIDESEVLGPAADKHRKDWRLLRRLALPTRLNEKRGGPVKKAAFVDVETTGLKLDADEVIQLAILPFSYEINSGRILEIFHDIAFEGLREPSVAISEEATFVTGLTAEMVAGKSIDPEAVTKTLTDVDLVIAHNAAFDRPMVEKHWPNFDEKPWSCSLGAVDWLSEGLTAGKLDYLGMRFGWFYDGHRALVDCEAGVALLAQTLPKSEERIMSVLRKAALEKDYLIRAVEAPYEGKALLKDRGYRWRPDDRKNGKVWWTMTDAPEAEIEWLHKEIYHYPANIPLQEITAFNRFSERIWEMTE